MHRSQIPQRFFDALDRKDISFFLRYWSALPPTGRMHHKMAPFVYAALRHLGEELMTGAQRFASDQRWARNYTQYLPKEAA